MKSDSRDRRSFWITARMGLVLSVVIVMFGAVVAKVYYLQAVQGEELSKKAVGQKSRTLTLKAMRGTIFDRNDIEMAVSVGAPSIFARPRDVTDLNSAASVLARVLDKDEDALKKRLSSSSPFVWIERQTTPAVAEAIEEAELTGIGITTESKRFYPLRETAGQLLGFVGIDGDGLEGIEARFDHELAGDEYQLNAYRDAHGRTLMTETTPEFREFEGNSVVLTIDARIQAVAERALADQVAEFDARGGYAVVLDAKTSEVLAMANTPDFDPNQFSEHEPSDWRLRNVTDTFEPGSVFKPLVLAAALQEGALTLTTEFDCEDGRLRIGRHTIRDSHATETLNAAEIIKKIQQYMQLQDGADHRPASLLRLHPRVWVRQHDGVGGSGRAGRIGLAPGSLG